MLTKYKLKPIAFSSFYSTESRQLSNAYYRILYNRLKETIVKKYDGKITPCDKENDEKWYNLIVNQKGITIDSGLKQTLHILSQSEFTGMLPAQDIEYLNQTLENHKLNEGTQYGLNIFTVSLTTGVYLSIYNNDLSSLIRLKKIYPGSYFIRSYINDIIHSFAIKAATQISKYHHSTNKIIKIIGSIDDLFDSLFTHIKSVKNTINENNAGDFFEDKYIYDFVILVNTLEREYYDNLYDFIITENKQYDARVFIAKEIKKYRDIIDSTRLRILIYRLLVNYFVYTHMLKHNNAKYVIEQYIDINKYKIHKIDLNNKNSKKILFELIDDLIHNIIINMFRQDNKKYYKQEVK